jgi:hypothetical protein
LKGNPFAIEGAWRRGNTHSHTTASDGALSVAELAGWYEENDYDFLVVTDHDVVADVSEYFGPLLVIPGAEIVVCWEGTFGAEICSLGIDEVRRKGVPPQDVIEDVTDQGGVPILSHPHLSGVPSSLIKEQPGLVGLEVFNAVGHAWGGGRGVASIHWDDVLMSGQMLWGIASDDRHSGTDPEGRKHDRGKAWIMVRSDDCTRTGIMETIREGHFYSSTGPEIHNITVTETEVVVECSPARSVSFITLPWMGGQTKAPPGETITEAKESLKRLATPEKTASFKEHLIEHGFLKDSEDVGHYFRVEVWDGDEGYAWSNPICL